MKYLLLDMSETLMNKGFQDVPTYVLHSFSSTNNIYHFNNQAKINGATMVASDSTMNFGVLISNFPHVIFSFGTAPEYEP